MVWMVLFPTLLAFSSLVEPRLLPVGLPMHSMPVAAAKGQASQKSKAHNWRPPSPPCESHQGSAVNGVLLLDRRLALLILYLHRTHPGFTPWEAVTRVLFLMSLGSLLHLNF